MSTSKVATKTKSKNATRKKTARPVTKVVTRSTSKSAGAIAPKNASQALVRAATRLIPKALLPAKGKMRPGHTRVSRPAVAASAANRQLVRMARAPQFNYMKAPGAENAFDVGDTVEVFCDHERNSERVRGWIKGVVVQVDNKLVAVQFRSNVFLTDGWMVPDRILWYSLTSDQIRAATFAKKGSRKSIPDY